MWVAAVAIVGAGVLTAYGQVKEGEERARIEEYNAEAARNQAAVGEAKGKLDRARLRKQAIAFRSKQSALYSKAGVMLTGSPLDIMTESAANAELDIMINRYNTTVQTQMLWDEAQQRNIMANQERMSSYLRAGSTLLTTVASAMTLGIGGGGSSAASSGARGGAIRTVRGAESRGTISAVEGAFS